MVSFDNRWIKTVSVSPPSLNDNSADTERVLSGLKSILDTETIVIDLHTLRKLPRVLRKGADKIKCVLFEDRKNWCLLDVYTLSDTSAAYGLAIDLGTSQCALQLIDLKTGTTAAEGAFTNPQTEIGTDILTRIHYAAKDHGLEAAQEMIIDALNNMIEELCRRCGCSNHNIYLASLAGNTAMTHLFMGLDPGRLIREPYTPVVNIPQLTKMSALGISAHPSARIFVFPNVGSYFGGDLIAGILYAGIHEQNAIVMLIDVGTNAEVVVGNRSWLVGCAGAAGPALEGDVTRMGMMAAPGAIDRVSFDSNADLFRIHTIDNLAPKGICGSGLIDLAACLFKSGKIDARGKLVPARCAEKLIHMGGMAHYIVVPAESSGTGEALYISQADIDSLIRSKAAMYTILETITAAVGLSMSDLSKIHVAGMFGAVIDPASAIGIGMLPDLPETHFKVLGNSSVRGAAMVITGDAGLEEIDTVRDKVTYLELNVNQDFMNRFSAAKFLPHTDKARFPSVNVPPGTNK